MKNKKGFTLVELLAVIAILAILMLLIMPNVLGMFSKGKKETFMVQVQSIIRAAETQKQNDELTGKNVQGYCNNIGSMCPPEMKLDITDSGVKYALLFNNSNKVSAVAVEDSNYCYVNSTDVANIDENDFVEGGHLNCTSSTCTCTGATRYVYWKLAEGGASVWYGPNALPTTTHDSVSSLTLSSTDTFIRSTVDDTGALKHEACFYYNNKYLCIGTDYFISGDTDGTQTKEKLETDMTNTFGTKPSCTPSSNRVDCYYGSARIKASTGDNMASDGTNMCNVNAANGKAKCS